MLNDDYLNLLKEFSRIANEMINEIYEKNTEDIMTHKVVNFATDRYQIFNTYSDKIHKILMAIKIDY